MATVKKDFDSYKISYNTASSTPSTSPPIAMIDFYSGSTWIAKVLFHPDGTTIPPNTLNSNIPYLHYAISSLSDIMEILRHEKPLYLSLNTDNLLGNIATSGMEPTGEEEP